VESAIELIEEAITLDSIQALDRFHSLRADICASIGMLGPQEAIERYSQAIELKRNGALRDACLAYQEAAALDPCFLWPLNNLAWMLSTEKDKSVRNGADALRYALEVCKKSNWNCWAFLGTLAASYAELGDFERAIGWQEICLRLAPPAQKTDCERILRHFQSGQAFVDENTPVAAGLPPEEHRTIQRHDYGKQCWWCGNPANSQEHRYKKADITRLFGKGPYKGDEALSRVVNGMAHVVQGPNSKELMFKANLCQNCNNERSQVFDRAYDQLITYLDAHASSIISQNRIQFSAIFGSDWKKSRENVIRYYVKHICCRLAECGVLIDSRVIDFLNGKGRLWCIEMNFEIRQDIVALEAKLTAEQSVTGSVWIGDGMADHHKSTNTFSRFYSHVGYRWLRVNYQYDESFTSHFNLDPADLLVLGTGYSVDPASI
jgi:tetratricopeptide (TPR) repeat protein